MHRSTSYQVSSSPTPILEHMYSQQQWTRNWIESIIQQPLPITNLFLCLRNGVILCRMMNRLQPGAVRHIHYNECISAKEENIRQFLKAGSEMGLQDSDLFYVHDLLEGKDMNAVIWTLSRLALLVNSQQQKQQQKQILWSSYDLQSTRYQQDSPSTVLSTCSPSITDNIHNDKSNHATDQDYFIIGNDVNLDKGLLDSRETTIYPTEDTNILLSSSNQQDQDNQGIKQYRQSIWSLPDEEDGIHWDHPVSPRTMSFDPSSPPTTLHHNMSRSNKTFSADSGYGTTRQSSWQQQSSNHHSIPLQLVSLFDPTASSSYHQQDSHSYTGSFTDDDDDDDDDDDEDDNKTRCTSYTPPIHDINNNNNINNNTNNNINNSTNNSINNSINNNENKSNKGSISSRLSSLHFGKRFSLRQKTPFHMRYQQWTESRLNNNNNNNNSNSIKPSVINMFPRSSEETSSPAVQASISSPLLSKNHHHDDFTNMDNNNAAIIDRVTPMSPIEQDLASSDVTSRRPSCCESMTRRKSTGTLNTHQPSTILRTSSDIVCQQDNLELIDGDGQITAKYKLGNVIGKGQFGIVYRALELRTGKMVAVKRIKLNSSKKRDILDAMQEAQLLQQLTHPNIVKYEGFIHAEGHVNIILEYVENGSLLNTLKSFGSFPENLVASYCTRILHGLQYLHDQNVVHCDLKAANLLTTKSGHVKLSDFGVSLNLRLKDNEVDAVAGTPNWMAPEVIELKGASTKSDIWSLGCTIVELCTGKPPYSDLLPMTALFRIVEDEYPPLPSGLSDDLCDFLRSCFAKNPDDRPIAKELLSHTWIRKYQQEEDLNTLSTQNILDDASSVRSKPTATTELATAPNTPQDLDYTDNDLPPWLISYTNNNNNNHTRSSSVLAEKFQQQQQQLHQYQYQQHQQSVVAHHYVKGTFPKGAVRCKSCQLPIKKDAFICEECGFICHDQCKNTSSCHKSTFMPPSKAIHDQPSPTLSYTQEPNTPLHRPTTTSYQPYQNRRSDSSYSIQALLSQHQLQHKQQTSSPKPRNSVSSQLRQRTHKLSRVFSSRLSSSPSPSLPPLHQHHPQQQRSSSQQRQQQQERSPHGSKSCDALRLIHEETYYSKENSGRLTKHDSEPSSTSSSSSYYPECPVDCDSSLSSGSSPSSPPCQIPSSTIQPLTKKQLAKREKLRRRATNPDDCIIS